MKHSLWILAAAALIALGCKKNDEPAPAPSPSTSPSASASATPTATPSTTPSGAPTSAPSGETGSYSLTSLAGEWSLMEKDAEMPGSSFTLSADGAWKMHVEKDGKPMDVQGTAKVEGEELVLTIMPPADAPQGSQPQEQKLHITEGGKRLKDPDGQNDLVKKS